MESGTAGGQPSQGPVIRTIKTRTNTDYTNYEDAVAIWDCKPLWRRLGFQWHDCQQVWLVKDICGLICAAFTWGLVFYADFVVIFVMLMPAPNQIHSIINGVIFQFFSIMALASHTKCMLTDPFSTRIAVAGNSSSGQDGLITASENPACNTNPNAQMIQEDTHSASISVTMDIDQPNDESNDISQTSSAQIELNEGLHKRKTTIDPDPENNNLVPNNLYDDLVENPDVSGYPENVMLLDLNSLLRRLKLPSGPKSWSRIWFVKNYFGVLMIVLTWNLIIYGEIVFFFFVVTLFQFPLYVRVSHGAFSLLCAFLGLVAHVRATFSDPGAVPRGNATKENIAKLGLKDGQVVYKCPKCISIKPERAHHCSVCRRCIRKMDHHCPWVNNCVGEYNQKFFVLFTLYICLISIHAMYMSIHHFVVCVGSDWKECVRFSPAATTIFMIFLLFESLLFGLFTGIMCGTQVSGICTDETGIEQLKKEKATWEKKSAWYSLRAVFGYGPASLTWLSPFHAPNLHRPDQYMYNV